MEMFLKLIVFACMLLTHVLGDDRLADTISLLIAKVDKLSDKMDYLSILDKAFKVSAVDERLKDLSMKMDQIQRQMTILEVTVQRPHPVEPKKSDEITPVESKLEQYGQKIIDQQNILRNEAREHLDTTRSFKGVVEAGMNKLFSKLDLMSRKKDPEEEEESILEELSEIKLGNANCVSTLSSTKKMIEDMHTDMFSEWTTSHRQMRQMDVKLDRIQNNSQSLQNHEELRLVTSRFREELRLLEDLEPKVMHAARLSDAVDTSNVTEPTKGPDRLVLNNLSSTVKGLRVSLQDRLATIREGVQVLDALVDNKQPNKSQEQQNILNYAINHLTDDINKRIDGKLQAVGEQVKAFLSTEVIASFEQVRNEFRSISTSMQEELSAEKNWRLNADITVSNLQHSVAGMVNELKKCNQPSTIYRDKLNRQLRISRTQ